MEYQRGCGKKGMAELGHHSLRPHQCKHPVIKNTEQIIIVFMQAKDRMVDKSDYETLTHDLKDETLTDDTDL